MGHSTDFIGHIDIEPPLNDAEIDYLGAICTSRRFDRADGPYDVPGNPRAETSDGIDPDRYNRCAPGQPNLWCDWQVCWEGCCLAWNGTEKSYSMIQWLRYLIAHFLEPGAAAAGNPRFAHFAFDHRLNGMVVGCRRDTKELFAVRVRDNRVTEQVLRPADPRYLDYPPLPYEEQIDREAADRPRYRRRRMRRTTAGSVVALDDRRSV
jgi:hypothetical protein